MQQDNNVEEVKGNLLSPAQWLRMLLMVLFMLAIWVLAFVLGAIVLVQTLIVLATGRVNRNLQSFGAQTSAYLSEIVDFLVYATERRPFPFAPFPAGTVAPDTVVMDTVVPATADSPVTPVSGAPEQSTAASQQQSAAMPGQGAPSEPGAAAPGQSAPTSQQSTLAPEQSPFSSTQNPAAPEPPAGGQGEPDAPPRSES